MHNWVVNLKGSLEDTTRCYELSVLRDDNRLGLESWGYGGSYKIILFGGRAGQNVLSPRTPESISVAMYAANSLRDAMNRRERIESKAAPVEQETELRYGDS